MATNTHLHVPPPGAAQGSRRNSAVVGGNAPHTRDPSDDMSHAAAETERSSISHDDSRRPSADDSIGSFHSELNGCDDEPRRRLSRNVSERIRDLIQRFAHRTERFKERTVQPPTPSTGSIDAISATSDAEEKGGRQRRLDSFVPPTFGVATDDQAGLISVGRWRFKLPRVIYRLKPPKSIDPNSLFYLCWLFIVTVAFLYNTAAAPLRTAFFRSPVYNATGAAPPPVASDGTNVATVCNSGVNTNGTATVGVNMTAAEKNELNCTSSEPVDNTTPYPDGVIGYFPGYQTPENIIYWWIADYTCDAIYIVDIIFVKRRVQFINNGLLETDPKAIFKNYVSKTNFKLDVVSLTPLDIFYLVPAINYCSLLRLPRILKIQSFWEFYDRLDQRVSSAHIVRIVRTVTYMFILIHIETCGFYAFSAYMGLGTDGWLYSGLGIAYIRCMYLAAKTAMSIGNNATPNNQQEYMFVTFYWLTGIFVFAMLIGQIRDIFQAADANRDRYRKTVDQTIYYMKSLNVPKELQDRVRMWFNYNWEHTQTLDENSLLEALPKKMKTDLAINVHFHTLSKVNLFQDCDKNLLYDLVLKLKPVLFLPGDYICRKGEVGKEMYIVVMGQVEVVGGPNNSIVFATLREGSVFGEISLLALAGGNRRTADVRSKGFAQLFMLSKADFEETMAEYPEVQKLLKKKAKRLLNQNKQTIERQLSADAEQVIKSRRGTPKLLRTVIQVIDEDSHIPDYLGMRRRSSYRSHGSPVIINDVISGGSHEMMLVQSSTAEHSGELEEVLIVTQTETPLNDVDVGSGSLVDADAAQSSLGTGVEASLLHADIGPNLRQSRVERTNSEGSLASAVRSILEAPLPAPEPPSLTVNVTSSESASEVRVTSSSRPSSRQNATLSENTPSERNASPRTSPEQSTAAAPSVNSDTINCSRQIDRKQISVDHSVASFVFRPPSPVRIAPPPDLTDDMMASYNNGIINAGEILSQSNC